MSTVTTVTMYRMEMLFAIAYFKYQSRQNVFDAGGTLPL